MVPRDELDAFIEIWGGYWKGQHKASPVEDWVNEVRNQETRLGYWEWAYWRTQIQEGEPPCGS